jgi:thymidine kinase
MSYEVTVVCDLCGRKELARTRGFLEYRGNNMYGDATILPMGWAKHQNMAYCPNCDLEYKAEHQPSRDPEDG